MRKLITLTLAVLLLGLCAAVVFAAVDAGDGSSSSLGTTTESTTGTTETTTTPTETTTTETTTTPQGGVDISGPCDEAEHANDPRCTGVGSGDHGDDFGDDSSGPGPGGDDDSGHGRGRGRGRGGDDD